MIVLTVTSVSSLRFLEVLSHALTRIIPKNKAKLDRVYFNLLVLFIWHLFIYVAVLVSSHVWNIFSSYLNTYPWCPFTLDIVHLCVDISPGTLLVVEKKKLL